jgi:hypothetical protein
MMNMRTTGRTPPQGGLGRWGADNSMASSIEDWQARAAAAGAGGAAPGAPGIGWHLGRAHCAYGRCSPWGPSCGPGTKCVAGCCQPKAGGGGMGFWGAGSSVRSTLEEWQAVPIQAQAGPSTAPAAAPLGQRTPAPAGCPSSVWPFLGGAVFWAFAGGIVLRLFGIGQKAATHGLAQLERKVPAAGARLPPPGGSRAVAAAERRRRSREQSGALTIRVPAESRLPEGPQWTNRFEIKSGSSDRKYIISQNKAHRHWGCSCPGWRTHRTCKHLAAIGLPPKEQPFEARIEASERARRRYGRSWSR